MQKISGVTTILTKITKAIFLDKNRTLKTKVMLEYMRLILIHKIQSVFEFFLHKLGPEDPNSFAKSKKTFSKEDIRYIKQEIGKKYSR